MEIVNLSKNNEEHRLFWEHLNALLYVVKGNNKLKTPQQIICLLVQTLKFGIIITDKNISSIILGSQRKVNHKITIPNKISTLRIFQLCKFKLTFTFA